MTSGRRMVKFVELAIGLQEIVTDVKEGCSWWNFHLILKPTQRYKGAVCDCGHSRVHYGWVDEINKKVGKKVDMALQEVVRGFN